MSHDELPSPESIEEAYQRGHEDGFWNGKTTDMSPKQAAAFMAPWRAREMPKAHLLSDHVIVWRQTNDSVQAEVECSADPMADCRLMCPIGCESFVIEHDADGPFHWYGDDSLPGARHSLRSDECNVVNFLTEDPMMIPEFNQGLDFIIGRVPIKPTWDGDQYLWERVNP